MEPSFCPNPSCRNHGQAESADAGERFWVRAGTYPTNLPRSMIPYSPGRGRCRLPYTLLSLFPGFRYYTPRGYVFRGNAKPGPREDDVKKVLRIEGMSCGHCSARVQKALAKVPGVSKAEVDLAEARATVEGEGFTEARLSAAVDEAGYKVSGITDAR